MTHGPGLAFDLQRRRFLQRTAGAGLALGVGSWLAGCGSGDEGTTDALELRTHFFDLSNADPAHDFFLVAGGARHPLTPVSRSEFAAPGGAPLPAGSEGATHVVTALLPATELQMCYVKGVRPGDSSGEWSMHMMFYHVPSKVTARVTQALVACGRAPRSLKYAALRRRTESLLTAALGVRTAAAAAVDAPDLCTDPRFDAYRNYFDQAVALVSHHPEVGSFDAPTLAYVQQAIICRDVHLLKLVRSLIAQGPATTSGGWATLVPVIDPETGQPERDDDGQLRYFTQHSAQTLALTGEAIRSVLRAVKNDPVLGANITDLGVDSDNPALAGKLWVVNNGVPTGGLDALLAGLGAGASASWALSDPSNATGYKVDSVRTDGRTVKFRVCNWFVRYLGLFIRYLDGAGKPIALKDLPLAIQLNYKGELSGPNECFLGMVNPEFVLLGIPLKQDEQWFSVEVPEIASSFQVLAGGLGAGTPSEPKTIAAGAVMTVVLDLAIPGVFLAMAASSAYKAFKTKVNAPASRDLMVATAQVFVLAIADSILGGSYYDTATFKNLCGPLVSVLKSGATWLYPELKAALANGQAKGAAASFLPFGVGLALQAVLAAGTAAEIAETSSEVANSPWTYRHMVKGTHPMAVTIRHDPRNVAGFPATATHYRLLAVCDGSAPWDSGEIAMPATTQTEPLVYVFPALPAGGKVNIAVSFYARNGWLAGAGSTGPIANTVDACGITIEERLVPLTGSTVYGHKQKIMLDAGGAHRWQATDVAPVVRTACDNTAGGLCELVGITLSEPFGALGYAWKSFSANVRDAVTGDQGQLYQFANLSFTQSPQNGYRFAGVGFATPARVAYERTSTAGRGFYIDASGGDCLVRQITFAGVDQPPTIALPASGQAVGRFNHSSDAFLVHPTGKLVSLNTALAKLEVLDPLDVPVADANAPLAQAYSGPGTRDGLLLGPACMCVTPAGAILVLEQDNNRIQAFDTGANPALIFGASTPPGTRSSSMPLREASRGARFLDVAMESVGYIYVLWVKQGDNLYTLDIYDPAGTWLAATSGVNSGKLTIDLFRNLFTLNFEALSFGGITEPSVSEWVPSTP
ncbi:hypothetical protein [Ramlibacter sp. AN1133]|uniref:hypothetical protein n=1 Tax=Ramlibacter sp. AN1133 TaxID=3133429 RepID=UPI0030C50542